MSSSSGAVSELQPAQLIYAPEGGCLATVDFAYGPRAAPPAVTWHGRSVDNFIQVYLQLAASAAATRSVFPPVRARRGVGRPRPAPAFRVPSDAAVPAEARCAASRAPVALTPVLN